MGIVKIIKGDIFKDFDNKKFDIIGHGCNCMNLMGAGIAATIAKRYPKAYETDAEFYATVGGEGHKPKHLMLGNISVARFKQGRIANLYTQVITGKDARYNALEAALQRLNNYCKVNQLKKVGLPMIGAGIGGLDSMAVLSIINQTMKDVDVYMYVYEDKMYRQLTSPVTGWENFSEPQYFDGVAVVGKDKVTLKVKRNGKVHTSYPPVEKYNQSNAQVTHPLQGHCHRAITFGDDASVYIGAATEEFAEDYITHENVNYVEARN